MKKIAALPAEKRARAEEAHRQHRLARAPLPGDERRDAAARRPRATRATSALPQPAWLPRTSAPHDAERAAGHEREAADVEAGVGAVALRACA